MRSMLTAVLAVACAACAGVPGYGPVEEVKLDRIIPLRADGTAEGRYAAGPFEIVKVQIRNQPTGEDVALSRDKEWDMSHPRPIVTVRSNAQHTARISLASILEDEGGKPLMVCKSRLDVELAPGFSDDWNTCQLEGMRTVDWPRVKTLHAVLTFRMRTGESPAAQGKPVGDVVEGPAPHCGGLPTPKDCSQ